MALVSKDATTQWKKQGGRRNWIAVKLSSSSATVDSNATLMQVFRDSTPIYTGSPQSGLADTGLAPDISYNYTVTISNDTSTASTSTGAGTVPTPPDVTASSPSSTELDLTIVADSGAGYMEIYRDGMLVYFGNLIGTYADAGLGVDSTHSYTVTTQNGNGVSSGSVTATTAPDNPTLTAVGNGTHIDLTIAADSAATSMEILRNGDSIYSGGVLSSYSDTGLPADSSYTYTVNTSNSNGTSSASATATTGPSDPTIIAAANGPNEIDLTITADSTATLMIVTRDGTTIYTGAPVGTLADTGLAANTTYGYVVTISNDNGSATASTTGTTDDNPPPDDPPPDDPPPDDGIVNHIDAVAVTGTTFDYGDTGSVTVVISGTLTELPSYTLDDGSGLLNLGDPTNNWVAPPAGQAVASVTFTYTPTARHVGITTLTAAAAAVAPAVANAQVNLPDMTVTGTSPPDLVQGTNFSETFGQITSGFINDDQLTYSAEVTFLGITYDATVDGDGNISVTDDGHSLITGTDSEAVISVTVSGGGVPSKTATSNLFDVTVIAPFVNIQPPTEDPSEDNRAGTEFNYLVSLPDGSALPVDLHVIIQMSGTAIRGSQGFPDNADYAVSGQVGDPYETFTVTIPAGSAVGSFTVVPFNDSLVEGPESIVATIEPDSHYRIGANGTATSTFHDLIINFSDTGDAINDPAASKAQADALIAKLDGEDWQAAADALVQLVNKNPDSLAPYVASKVDPDNMSLQANAWLKVAAANGIEVLPEANLLKIVIWGTGTLTIAADPGNLDTGRFTAYTSASPLTGGGYLISIVPTASGSGTITVKLSFASGVVVTHTISFSATIND